jgi:hypothetical protein
MDLRRGRRNERTFLESSNHTRRPGCLSNGAARETSARRGTGAIVKHGILLASVLTLLAFLVSTIPSSCQEAVPPSPESNNTGLPNAPSVTKATTCTEENGKPCPEWVHKLIGQYPPLPESATPQPERNPSSVHFWTYRGSQDPPLRTNKQVFHSKIFLAAHVGGAVAMIVACRSKNSGEDWGSEVPAVAAMFGMDYLQFRFVGGPNAVGPAIYEMIHYSRASTR